MRIAMWSGPRNISTALMYSFAARGDFEVVDEPFYAAYLHLTGHEHPMREEVLRSQPTDPERVIKDILAPVSDGFVHSYHKLMTQHMQPGVPRDWIHGFKNVFLIRHPARVIASYVAKRENPTLDDLGFLQQADLYDEVKGEAPVIIDSSDIRSAPRAALETLCAALGLPFTETMLNWPEGGHPADGIWADYWYGAVHNSTGFGEPEGAVPDVPDALSDVFLSAMACYERLRKNSLCIR